MPESKQRTGIDLWSLSFFNFRSKMNTESPCETILAIKYLVLPASAWEN